MSLAPCHQKVHTATTAMKVLMSPGTHIMAWTFSLTSLRAGAGMQTLWAIVRRSTAQDFSGSVLVLALSMQKAVARQRVNVPMDSNFGCGCRRTAWRMIQGMALWGLKRFRWSRWRVGRLASLQAHWRRQWVQRSSLSACRSLMSSWNRVQNGLTHCQKAWTMLCFTAFKVEPRSMEKKPSWSDRSADLIPRVPQQLQCKLGRMVSEQWSLQAK
mmetsp:Transcript_99739/g.197826  ORF Transcript_99739/g.197826 Transcript_99739/m.197826 type:complete len:214 (-) Transcript_99739:249-890(-)